MTNPDSLRQEFEEFAGNIKFRIHPDIRKKLFDWFTQKLTAARKEGAERERQIMEDKFRTIMARATALLTSSPKYPNGEVWLSKSDMVDSLTSESERP